LINTSGAGSEAAVRAYYATAASPDMVFTRTPSGELGAFTWRIDDADIVAPDVKNSAGSNTSFVATWTLPTVASAPNGVGLVAVGVQGPDAVSSSSLGFTEDYDADAVPGGFWVKRAAMLRLDSVTPGGGTWTPGTMTVATTNSIGYFISIVVKTSAAAKALPPFNRRTPIAHLLRR
jgi:hypothetical protein